MQVQAFAGIPLDISDFPTRHNYGLALWQDDFERYWPPGSVSWGCRSRGEARGDGIHAGRAGVDVELSDGRSLRAEYLVGCDGGRSVIRKTAGIESKTN